MERCAPLTICTMRPAELLRRCAAAEIPLRVLSPLDVGARWAAPYLIDAVEMPLPTLAELLAAVEPPRRTRRRVRRKLVGVLLDPADQAARQLAALAPGVSLLLSERFRFGRFLPWVRHFPAIRPLHGTIALGVRPVEPLPLPQPFLRLFAALPHAGSMAEVAERATISRPTVQRVLARTRAVLGLPTGSSKRFSPVALAELFAQALTQAPLTLASPVSALAVC